MKRPSNSRGFGLIEMMVAMVVTAVVLVAVYTAFFRSQQAARDVSRVIERRQNARLAIQLLERDLRMAGSGFGRTIVGGAYNGNALMLGALSPGYGGSESASDTIGILGAWDVSTSLSSGMPNSSAELKVDDASGFNDGDFCIVTNGVTADLFQVTHVSIPAGKLQHNPSSPYNSPGGHSNWPAGGYGTGATVFRMTWVSYRVDSTSYKRRVLIRRQAGGTDQIVAYDIRDFQVAYDLQDGSTTRDPADLAMIDKVRPIVRTVSALTGQAAQEDSARASLRPRAF
jgi:prepilin-type N-terminal cleavage/methylation domain-containing protein